jgi:hypothetical protein
MTLNPASQLVAIVREAILICSHEVSSTSPFDFLTLIIFGGRTPHPPSLGWGGEGVRQARRGEIRKINEGIHSVIFVSKKYDDNSRLLSPLYYFFPDNDFILTQCPVRCIKLN